MQSKSCIVLDMEDGELEMVWRTRPARGVHIQLGKPNWVWATVCTADRNPWLACDEAHGILRKTWLHADRWLVTDYVLMPDHLHFLAAPLELEYSLDSWMTYWKRQFRKNHTHLHWRWQPNSFHHRLRNGESYREKWSYLRENPIRKGLAQRVEDWPFIGRIHPIHWSGD